MAGTSGYFNSGGGGGGLPVPDIKLARPLATALNPLNPNEDLRSNTPNGSTLRWHAWPLFSAHNLPSWALESTAELRLELLWFRNGNNRKRGSGYRHPSHTYVSGNPTGPTGFTALSPALPNGRAYGGGRMNGVYPGDMITEWVVSDRDQRFFIDTLGQFFEIYSVQYEQAMGGAQFVPLPCPTHKSSAASAGANSRNRGFAYCKRYQPNYFQFRFSCKDESAADPRDRIYGPTTQTVVAGLLVHPFLVNAEDSQAQQRTTLDLSPVNTHTEMNCWFNTRLPGYIA
jgi:hypothetical protein